MMLLKTSLGAALLLAATVAAAQSSRDPLDTRIFNNGLWLGGGVGWTDSDSSFGSVDFSDDSVGYNIGIGYQFANYFGINARWRDLGEFEDTVAGTKYELELDGYSVGLSAGYPFSGRIAGIAGIGYYDFDAELSPNVSGVEDDDGLYLTAGLASAVGRIVISPQVVYYDSDLTDLWSVELNFYWKIETGN